MIKLEEFCTLFNLKVSFNKETCCIVYSLWLESIPPFSSVITTTILNSLIAGIKIHVFIRKSVSDTGGLISIYV